MRKSLSTDLKVFAKHLNILIVEDEVDLGTELQSMLSLFFNKVYYAKDGEEGLKFFKKYKCDIVITDLNMPKKNGVELAREVRILDRDQVIMVLSGYIDSFVIDLIDIGIQSLMLKPYKIENFMQKLLVQCENIVLKKEFEKMKVNKTLKNYAKEDTLKVQNNTPKNNKNKDIEDKHKEKATTMNSILDEVAGTKTTENSLNDYISRFNVDKQVDTTMWKHISSDIADLNEDYEDCINRIVLNGFNEEIKNELIHIFSRYNYSLSLLPGLEEFTAIFKDLSNTLETLDLNNIQADVLEVFDIFEFFYDDIIKFFNLVFIENETKNLNYLTDSLQSSVKQLKMKLGMEGFEEEDLELF